MSLGMTQSGSGATSIPWSRLTVLTGSSSIQLQRVQRGRGRRYAAPAAAFPGAQSSRPWSYSERNSILERLFADGGRWCNIAGMKRHERRKAGLRALADFFADKYAGRCIHYSCESFYDRLDGPSPRVTSIAVRHYASGQTRSFSIHQVAERRGSLDTIHKNYDELEREMLCDFFRYVKEQVEANNNTKWLHWKYARCKLRLCSA